MSDNSKAVFSREAKSVGIVGKGEYILAAVVLNPSEQKLHLRMDERAFEWMKESQEKAVILLRHFEKLLD